MEDSSTSNISDGEIIGIRFGMATRSEICTASISDSSISHASQLSNPFLGLPLEFGRCESCGTAEAGKCEGHFGYIELPVPIYHPSHVSELKRMLSLVCLNCLKMKKAKVPASGGGLAQRLLSSCCQDTNAAQVSIREVRTADGACYLALKIPKSKMQPGCWRFLEKYGYRYEGDHTRALLPCEVMEIIKRLSLETKRKLAGKGYFPQEGYVLKYLPVPPNCLSVPEVSDGVSIMSSDPSITILRKLLRKVEIIRSSRSGEPNFESHHVEANELQSVVDQYLQVRGTSKAARDIETHFGVNKELSESSTKAWLEKMRTLFIRKGSGFSSRSVITGDGYKRINEIGIPVEVAQRITFEERVNIHNMSYLQKLVDENLCLTYREGVSTYSLREGSKGHIYLKPGQIVHRRIMDGDIVFINRPPTTHKHSLQALAVYIHDDHTVKINPLICGPLGADFDGDCIHLFYPQSLAAKAEVLELFAVEKQLLSSHSGNLNLQLTSDSLLSLKMLVKACFLDRAAAHQLAMFLSLPLPRPTLLKANSSDCYWSAMQMLQCALPSSFDCPGGRYLIRQSEILDFDFNRDVLPSMINEIAASIFFAKGPQEALNFFDLIQPFLMEYIFAYGFSVSLQDFSISRAAKRIINRSIAKVSPLLYQLRSIYNELVAKQLEKYIQDVEQPVIKFALKSSRLGDLIDSKSKSAIDKVVQQIGFLGQQLFERGRFYSKGLIEDVASHFHSKCCYDGDGYPSAEYGLLKGCFFHGLDPYEEMVHSISTREILVRSSRGLSEPGTLFKNLMAVLRDVVICYDGTVRNVCSNSIIQFEYGMQAGDASEHLFPAGEPVGVLAATSMSNPAYKAVLDASPNSNSSWELMKEILLCKVNFRNEPIDRRVILYLNDCGCGKTYCRENAAYLVKNHLSTVSLKDAAEEFIIEYEQRRTSKESSETDAGLVGHIHLNEAMLKKLKINMGEVFERCQERLNSFNRKKKVKPYLKSTILDISESCTSSHSSAPCVRFIWLAPDDIDLDKTANIMADIICPVLFETIIKGDPRISSASIIWVNPDTNMWVRNPCKSQNGELALDITLEKTAVKQSGDAWRIVLDSCLPVLHLIDTRRSIPYAIKQIQELLGISCTFDQAIQRLAASVKMVAKGVLREHLILLASNMTCGGNLVGFNTGGYKALARQLNIQVPFADATLFTPRKCFERAAEKCHTDSLSSIVASCSWGKHVAVGTGSRFDVVWDTKETKPNEIGGLDVYNFLHMVKSLTNGEGNNDCLGEDIDDLLEEEDGDWGMSPQHAFGFDAVFEENYELLNGTTSNGWDTNVDASKANSDDWVAWERNPVRTNDGGNDAWGGNKSTIQDDGSNAWAGNKSTVQDDGSDAWGGNKSSVQDDGSDAWGGKKSTTQDGGSDAWGGKKSTVQDGGSDAWGGKKSTIQDDRSNAWGGNKSSVQDDGSDAWGGKKSTIQDGGSDAWGGNKSTVQDGVSDAWGGNKTKIQDGVSDAWGGNKTKIQDGGSERAQQDSWSTRKWKSDNVQEDTSRDAWEARTDTTTKSNEWSSAWAGSKSERQDGRTKTVQEDSRRNQKWKSDAVQEDSSRDAWEARTDTTTKSNEWSSAWVGNKSGRQEGGSERAQEDSWSSRKWKADSIQEDTSKSSAWEASTDETKTSSNDWAVWGKNKSQVQDDGSERAQEDTWSSGKWKAESKAAADDIHRSSTWDAKTSQNKPKSKGWSASGSNKDEIQDGRFKRVEEGSWSSGRWKGEPKVGTDVMPEASSKDNAWERNSDNAKVSESKESDLNWDAKLPVEDCSWGKPKSSENQAWNSQNKSNQAASSDGWDSQIASSNTDSDRNFQWGKQGRESIKKNSFEGSQENQAWNSQNESNPDVLSSRGWDSQIASTNSDSDRNFQWGKQGRESFKKNRNEGSQGRGSNAGDRKNWNRPPRPPGRRLDNYTPEEQEVFKSIESILQSIRRIMQNQGYNDGDPLPADDQLFVLENVFEYHPDKETKIGAGVDYVMISRHSSFQESRCFYVVSKDGQREDFSYRKCLSNFVRTKYPDVAESFINKYFAKPPPRARVDQASSLGDQASTPVDQPSTPGDQPSTPVDQPSTPVDQASTPGDQASNE